MLAGEPQPNEQCPSSHVATKHEKMFLWCPAFKNHFAHLPRRPGDAPADKNCWSFHDGDERYCSYDKQGKIRDIAIASNDCPTFQKLQ
jgi:hypothetical protein